MQVFFSIPNCEAIVKCGSGKKTFGTFVQI